jgi:hypothetical protein
MTYKLPEHTIDKGAHEHVLTFAEPLTAADATLVHRHLRGKYPGAGIATTGDRLVTVTPVATSRPRKSTRKTP